MTYRNSFEEYRLYWEELVDLDETLYANAQSCSVTPRRWRRPSIGRARDAWTYLLPIDTVADDGPYPHHPEDRYRAALWEGTRKSETIIAGKLSVGQVVTNPTSDTGTGHETRYVYGYIRPHAQAYMIVARNMFDMVETERPPEQQQDRFRSFNEAIDRGLLDPTPEDYEALLAEMRRGASGEHRVFIPYYDQR